MKTARDCDICGRRFFAPSHREQRCSEECRKAGRAKKYARWYYKNHLENVRRQQERREALPEEKKKERLAYAREHSARRRLKRTESERRATVRYQTEYNRRRAARDPVFKAMNAIRVRLNAAIRRRSVHRPKHRTEKFLGCTWQVFVEHIEGLFESGMTWDNWGRESWHIDHIVPLAAFDLSDPAECMVACHYRNHRPMRASDNIGKAAAMPAPRSVPAAFRRMLLDLDPDFFSRPTYRRRDGRGRGRPPPKTGRKMPRA
jgi:hypothetical protein